MALTYGFTSLTATVIGTQTVQGVVDGYPVGVGNNERDAYEVGINALAAPAGDIFQFSVPTGAKTARLTDIVLQNNGAAAINVRIQKRSTLNSLNGTSTVPAVVPNSSASAAATGVVRTYTVVPVTPGTSLGDILDIKLPVGGILVFGDLPLDQPPELIGGGTQALAIVIDAIATISGHIQWTEE